VSSTSRGANRQDNDYYVTPVSDVVDFLCAWLKDEPSVLPRLTSGRVLDPCAGGNARPVTWEYKPGEHVRLPPTAMSYPEAIRKVVGRDPADRVITNDIRADSPAGMHLDFLGRDFIGELYLKGGEVDVVMTNPPFSRAMEIIQRAHTLTAAGGYVVMLLRLNFFGSDKRFDFFRNNMPYRTYVHHKRMGFLPDGKTDSIEYMHAVWRVQDAPITQTILRVI